MLVTWTRSYIEEFKAHALFAHCIDKILSTFDLCESDKSNVRLSPNIDRRMRVRNSEFHHFRKRTVEHHLTGSDFLPLDSATIFEFPRHKRSLSKSALLQTLELSRLEFAQDTPFRFAVLLALNFKVRKPRILKVL